MKANDKMHNICMRVSRLYRRAYRRGFNDGYDEGGKNARHMMMDRCDRTVKFYEKLIGDLLTKKEETADSGFTTSLINQGFTKGYLNAIDDFSEEISRKFLGVHPDELHTPFYPYEIVKIIKEIAEKMKKGER